MTDDTLPGVPDAPLVRRDVAERLVLADKFLRTDSGVREALGAPARLLIVDALRPYEVQRFAYEVAWPSIIKQRNPELSDEELEEEVAKYCAKPRDNLTPTPHLTGGAVDVRLMNAETDEAFDRGFDAGDIGGKAFPDFHEGYHLHGDSDIEEGDESEVAPERSEIVLGRRALYYAMTEVAGLEVNPNEIWHYGKGDPLSEFVSGSNTPYYDVAKLPDWYKQQMSISDNKGKS